MKFGKRFQKLDELINVKHSFFIVAIKNWNNVVS